jgi:HEAT repeat protein
MLERVVTQYLEAIVRHFSKWQELYTLTDVEGRRAQAKKAESFFDFGLMVQAVVPQNDRLDHSGQKETVEQLTVLKGLRKYAAGHVLLVGRPGSGKSTALARLMLEVAGDVGDGDNPGRGMRAPTIPVLVELRSWQTSIVDLIRNALKRHGWALGAVDVEKLLGSDRLLLLVDGVNELPSEAARIDVANFRRDHPKVLMIFTTRDLRLGGDLGIEKQLEMQPLSDEQMKAFIQAYLPEQADAMLRQLQGRLRELGRTPLLLWMLCSLFRKVEAIPTNLGEVFRIFTQGYERQIKQDVVVESDRRWWPGLLQELAAAMMNPVGARIPRPDGLRQSVEFRVTIAPSEIETVFTAYLQDKEPQPAGAARKALDDLLKHHLLQRNGDSVEFRHQLIQEYYAAEWLLVRVRDLDNDTLKREYLNYLKWTESIALMLGLPEINQNLAVKIVEQALGVDLMLGARLAGELSLPTDINIRKVRRKIRIERLRGEVHLRPPDSVIEIIINQVLPRKIEDKLLSLTLKSTQYHNHSLNKISENIDSEERIDTLIDILEITRDVDVFREAVRSLGYLRSKKAVPVLLSFFPILLNESPEVESLDLVYIIKDALIDIHREVESNGDRPDHKVCSNLIGFLQDKKLHSCVREAAAECLGSIDCKSSISALIESSRDEDLGVRRSSIEALGNIGCQTCIHALEKAISDADFSVRWVAKLALAKLGVASESTIAQLIEALEYCHYHLTNPNDWEYFVDDDGSEVVVETYCVEYDEEISWAAAGALAKLDSPILPALKKSLFSNSENSTPHLEATMYAISSVQSNCKFYNYEIQQQAKLRKADRPSLEGGGDDRPPNVTYNINRVGNLNTGTVNIHGNQNGEQ